MTALEQIEKQTQTPSQRLIDDLAANLDGDVLILGVSGKMGCTVAALLKAAIDAAGLPYRVLGAARFSDAASRKQIEDLGVDTYKVDFLDDDQLRQLPPVKNVIYMVGYKFGTTGNEPYTWAINSYLPGRICEHFKNSNIVAFSTGCVYPLTPVIDAAPSEETGPDPLGEYAQSCLGRERIFEHFAKTNLTPVTIFRLNYAIDLKYGILSELGQTILADEPIDLTMGQVNVIWQKDACEMAIRSLFVASTPANVINITGPETLSVRWLSERLAEQLHHSVTFTGQEGDVALLSNASKAHELFGYPETSIREMIEQTSEWLLAGGALSNKPTHFQEREGKY